MHSKKKLNLNTVEFVTQSEGPGFSETSFHLPIFWATKKCEINILNVLVKVSYETNYRTLAEFSYEGASF